MRKQLHLPSAPQTRNVPYVRGSLILRYARLVTVRVQYNEGSSGKIRRYTPMQLHRNSVSYTRTILGKCRCVNEVCHMARL